jgi:predicted acylesterase/phospholipase RssA
MGESKEAYKRLVLSGGSIKGVAYIGALKFMEENRETFCQIDEFVGTSIGALMCLLIALNYSSKELKDIFWELDFNNVKDFSFKCLLEHFGLDKGDKVETLVKKFITDKKLSEDITIQELYNITGKSLVCCATDINSKATKYFDRETCGDAPVHLAVRASMNIPLVFAPIIYQGRMFVDGALTNDIPVSYSNPLKKKVLCLCLDSSQEVSPEIKGLEEYISTVVKVFLRSINSMNKELAKTLGIELIEIKSGIDTSMDFSLSNQKKEELYSIGYQALKDKFTIYFNANH